MSESESTLDDLQRRITAAMERIGRGVEALDRPAPSPMPDAGSVPVEPEDAEAPPADPDSAAPAADLPEMAELTRALEEERLASAQLEERVKDLRARQEEAGADHRKTVEDLRRAMAALDADLQSLRLSNARLRENNSALREANAAGLADATLIDAGMAAELAALRAGAEADRSEAAAILAALSPLMPPVAEPDAPEPQAPEIETPDREDADMDAPAADPAMPGAAGTTAPDKEDS